MLWGLLSALMFGTADFFAANSSKRIGAYTTLYYMQFVGFALLCIVMAVSGEWHAIRSISGVAAACVWMLVDLVGILLLYRGLLAGQASIVAPIASSFSVVTVSLSIAFGEHVDSLTLAGIALTIVGIIGATMRISRSNGRNSSHAKFAKGALWAILAALFLGTAFFGLRYPVEDLGGIATVWVGRLQAVILLPLLSLLGKWKLSRPNRGDWGNLLIVGALDAFAIVSYNLGLWYEQTSIVITAASLFAIVTLIWGVLLGKERLMWNQWIGVTLTFAGITIVSLG
ncbi:EamA family transporter [Brevibacillus choshinensis]|uniref:EamA family transporter n=1 Tax=Brevibacillus choshinensis TaxID=54911 RepID=UPI002E201C01|nr:EamA family transporter [Brevibacillus choshinensis]MED4755406.1 EamA family transporter [Brevibacillus choshinensis]